MKIGWRRGCEGGGETPQVTCMHLEEARGVCLYGGTVHKYSHACCFFPSRIYSIGKIRNPELLKIPVYKYIHMSFGLEFVPKSWLEYVNNAHNYPGRVEGRPA